MSLDVHLNDPTSTYGVGELYWANITHNLGNMASKAGIYKALWHPDEVERISSKALSSDTVADDIIPLLELGLSNLKARPEYFKQFDAENGWGTYEQFVPWVEEYLVACKEFPKAVITVSG